MAEAGRSLLANWIYRVLTMGLALSLAMVLGEFAIRTFLPQQLSIWDMDEGGLTIHRKNIRMRATRGEFWIETNSLGMRDAERSDRKEPGEFRVLVLGDSFMEAIQVPFEQSFPRQLRRMVLERCEGVFDVINASVSGWGTDDELRFLRTYGDSLKPDVVLVSVTLHNDISDNLLMEFHQFVDGHLISRPTESMSGWQLLILRTKVFFATRSHLYQFVYGRLISGRVRVSGEELSRHVEKVLGGDAEIAIGWQMTRALLDEMKRTTESLGARLVLMLIPIRMQLGGDEGAQGGGPGEAPGSVATPQRLFRQWAEDRGIALVDLLPAFREWQREMSAPLYLDVDGHWTREGHELAARVTDHSLRGRGVLPACGPSGGGALVPLLER